MTTGVIQFHRNYQLQIGAASLKTAGVFIDQLRCTFSIDKTLESFPNRGVIEVYNLSRKSRSNISDTIDVVAKERRGNSPNVIPPTIFLSAGYRDNVGSIFKGDITHVTTRKIGTDIITTFEVGDGISSFTDSKLDVSFNPGVTAQQVLNAITNAMGLQVTPESVARVNLFDQWLQGLTLTGAAKDHLTKVLKKQGLSWSIQDNQIQILPAEDAVVQAPVLLNKGTGLIGSPYRTKVLNDNPLKKKGSTEIETGVQAMALLNPDIRPGRLVQIQSEVSELINSEHNVNGVFKVTKCRHIGDTHGQHWYTEIVAE